jgi:hypothetical protein
LARSLKDQAPVKSGVTAQIAVAVAIVTSAPVRARNLTSIRLGENLIKSGGPNAPYLLVFPHFDVKNRVDLEFEFDDFVTAVIDEYVHGYRPILMRGRSEDWLFPGETGGFKDPHFLGIQVTEPSRRQRDCGSRSINIAMPQPPSQRLRDGSPVSRSSQHPKHYQFRCGLETTQCR